MPTKNPVTRFGGFSGFGPQPTSRAPVAIDSNGRKVVYYGPGIGEYSRDQTHGPLGRLQPGDAALAPDLARQMRLKYGDYFTFQGKTYRYADASYVSPNRPNSNTVEIWLPPGQKPGAAPSRSSPISDAGRTVATAPASREPALPAGPGADQGPGLFADQKPSVEISPTGPQTPSVEITPRSEPTPGRSATLTTDPNDDWTGAETPSNAAIAGSASLSPVNNPADYAGFASPTLSGETLRSLPNERWTPETEWWKQGTEMAGRDIGASTTFADAGGSIFDQHEGTGVPFETYTDTSTLTAEGNYPAPQPEPNFPEPQYPPPQPESPLPAMVYEAPVPDNQYVDTGPESNDFVRQNWYDESGFEDKGDTSVASRDVLGGSDQSTRPVPNLLSFGLGPFAGFGTGVKVAGGDVGSAAVIAGDSTDIPTGQTIATAGSTTYAGNNGPAGSVGSQGQVETGYGPMGELDFKGTKVSDPNTQWVKDPQLGWVPRAQAAPPPGLLTQAQYAQQTFGGLRGVGYIDRSGSSTGYGQSLSSQENAKIMEFMSYGGTPNRVAVTETAEGQGHNLTFPGRGGARGTARSLLLTTAAGRARAGGRG